MLILMTALQVAVGTPDSVLNSVFNYVRIDDRLATSGQIDSAHIQAIAASGFDVVINLAPARAERNETEAFNVAQAGLTYVNIPVSWEAPSLEDLKLFFAVMKANEHRNVYVHCFANMRASAFTYLYRTLEAGVDASEAKHAMLEVWNPEEDERYPQWAELLRVAPNR